jgi:hypothetical protein
MVGVINAPAYNEPFTAFLKAAKAATATGLPSSSTSPSSSTLSSNPSTFTPAPPSSKAKAPVGAIVGSVVGGLIALGILAAIILLRWRRRAAQRLEAERLTAVTAFVPGPDLKAEMELLRAQVQRLETERRPHGSTGGSINDPSPPETFQSHAGPVTDTLVHTDSGLRLAPDRIVELPPRYVAD